MALKSSQPRRNALPKSERLILRTTKVAETPNSCSLGLANTVAIAPVSLLVIATNLVVRATPAIAKIAVRSNVAAPPEAEATPTAAKTAATEAAAAKTAHHAQRRCATFHRGTDEGCRRSPSQSRKRRRCERHNVASGACRARNPPRLVDGSA